jgi:type VI secretion system secreted protein VgrG
MDRPARDRLTLPGSEIDEKKNQIKLEALDDFDLCERDFGGATSVSMRWAQLRGRVPVQMSACGERRTRAIALRRPPRARPERGVCATPRRPREDAMSYTQRERMSRVVSPLGEDALLLLQLRGEEALSRPFRFELELLSERADVAFEQVVGKPLAVALEPRSGAQRWFHGLCERFEEGPAQGRFASYRAVLVPWFALLSRRTGLRIFQHRSVPEIARQLFAELGFSDYKFELIGSYPPLEYCVQYRETDFDFVSRLFEDAGIGYYFAHEKDVHTLIAFDSSAASAPCPQQPQATHVSTAGPHRPDGGLCELRFERELRAGAYALGDFRFEQPRLPLQSATASVAGAGSRPAFEVYEWPGGQRDPADGDARAVRRIEAEECAGVRGTAQSCSPGFVPGYRFELRGHFRSEYNTAHLITAVCHWLGETVGQDAQGHSSYRNRLELLPHAVPYRPPRRTPRPIAHGVQTATVVGAPGLEIDVDAHGRVIVQFHWDREGRRDASSSCRVRVAQGWAGKGWGAVAHPRVGQEVIVEFVDGDPDRPLITGRVYNAEQTPPYPLPAQASRSGVVSRSTPGGGPGQGNELCFEDKRGSELLYVQAERDRSTLTKGDDTQRVGGERKRSVGGGEQVEIAGDCARRVGGAASAQIGAQWTLHAGDAIELRSGAARLVLQPGGEIELSGTTITLRGGGTVLRVDPGGGVTVNGRRVQLEG